MPSKQNQPSHELAHEVASLCERIDDNRQLTREVATLLFRLGERPTANRVLQLTRRGSMNTVNDEVNKWWDDVRSRLSSRLINPKVPAALLEKQGELIGAMWDTAIAEAQEELEADRAELEGQVVEANIARAGAESQAREQGELARELQARLEEVQQALASERTAREAAGADAAQWRERAEKLGNELEEARADFTTRMDRARTEFTTEVEAQRRAAEAAAHQHEEARKHILLELDGIRTRNTELRASLKKAEATIGQLRESEADLHRQAVDQATTIARLTGETAALSAKLEAAETEQERLIQARVEDRQRYIESLGLREDMIAQLNDTLSTMKQTETLLRSNVANMHTQVYDGQQEIARLRSTATENHDEIARLRSQVDAQHGMDKDRNS